MEPLDKSGEILEELRGSGSLDSAGHFTIDFASAREKLRAHLLGDPHEYALKFVQVAVMSGATCVQVREENASTTLLHDGIPATAEQLGDLLGYLLGVGVVGREQSDGAAPSPQSLQALATALNAALELPGATVSITSWNGNRAARLRCTARQMSLEPAQTEGIPHGVMFEVTHDRPVLSRRLAGEGPAAALIRERCDWAPLPVQIGAHMLLPGELGARKDGGVDFLEWKYVACEVPGKVFPVRYDKLHPLIEVRFVPEPTFHGTIGICPQTHASVRCHAQWSDAAPLTRFEDELSLPPQVQAERAGTIQRCRAVLSLLADVGAPSRVELVSQGVTLWQTLELGGLTGVSGAVCVDALPKDLSGMTLQASALQELEDQAGRNARRMYALLEQHWQGELEADRAAHLLTGVPGARMTSFARNLLETRSDSNGG